MRQSNIFTKTRKEGPSDEVSKNAELLIRGGFIHKEMAGVYSFLPLGVRVLKKIEDILREEMNKAGGQEILMPALQPKEYWETTGRWDTLDVLYKVADTTGRESALGPTHEEVVVPLAKQYISSYKDLPFAAYQIQNKFRMELRAKSGILRGREFIMKDLYSFHRDEADLARYYENMKAVYARVYERVGIGAQTYFTFASGGSFSKYSHEFQTVTPAGEDVIYLCKKCRIAVNSEIVADQPGCPACGTTDLTEEKAIEVGNIFELKTKYSDPFNLTFKDEDGAEKPVLMGCYGIGVSRLLGAVVEVLSDEKGIVWPESIAPYRVHMIEIKSAEGGVKKYAENLYDELVARGVEVLYDDRAEISAGEKFADADLLGMPRRIIVSEKSIAAGGIEIKGRTEEGKGRIVSREEFLKSLNP
ncbi:MAG: proline--tRNA ligase [Minisyncoccota bacterium]